MHPKWFSACVCLRYQCDNPINQTAWEPLLQKLRHRPIGEAQRTSTGFSSPFGYLAPNIMSHEMQGYLFLSLTHEKKSVPRNKLNRLFMLKLEERANKEGGSISDIKGAERKAIKEQTEAELLKKTVPDEVYINAILDTKHQLLYVDSSSQGNLDLLEKKLQHVDKSFSQRPYFDASVEVYLTQWVYDPATNLPKKIILDSDATLLNDEKAKAAFSNQNLESDELINLIRHDKRVTELGVHYDGRMRFKLNAKGQLKKMKPTELTLSDIQKDHEPQGAIEDMEAFWLVLANTLTELYEWLGGLFAVNTDHPAAQDDNEDDSAQTPPSQEGSASNDDEHALDDLAAAMGNA